MSKYKAMMANAEIMQKDLLTEVQRADGRVDKSLLSKIVNDVCLPTPKQLAAICSTIECGVYDLYDHSEIDLTQSGSTNTAAAVATPKQSRGGLSHGENIYNLTVEIDRDIAERVFSKENMRKLGIKDRSDFIRQCVVRLDRRLAKILAKEKATQ